MKKILLSLLFISLFIHTNSFGQAPNCAGASPICSSAGLTYPNVHNGSQAETNTGIEYDCLGSEPNPNWFDFQVGISGALNFHIQQSTTSGGPANLDVDFICWGPFTSPMCSGTNLNTSTEVGCSYSAAATENFSIPNALSGQIYPPPDPR